MYEDPSKDRGAPLVAVVESAGDLFSQHKGVAEAAAARIRRALADPPLSIVATLDRALRDGGLHRRVRREFVAISPGMLGRVDRLSPEDRRLALVIASCLRSGFTRADALRRLAVSFDPWVAAVAVVRLTDFVPAIAEDAERILRAHLRPSQAGIFVRILPLLDRLDRWSRAGRALAAIRDLLVTRSLLCERALWEGARAQAPGVRLPACRLLSRRFRDDPRIEEVYALALADPSPVTRRWGAQTLAASHEVSPQIRRRLLPTLSADRSPAIRRLAVRLWAQEDDGVEHLVAAAFDGNSDVRHHARVALAQRKAAVDYRGRALKTLAAPTSKTALIGALATLSDFGRRADIPVVHRFIDEPRSRVAAEATRTAEMLELLPRE